MLIAFSESRSFEEAFKAFWSDPHLHLLAEFRIRVVKLHALFASKPSML